MKIYEDDGFTLMELVVVLAIMAVLAAILVPNFTSVIGRMRLKSDIQSTRVLQGACDLYVTETSTNPTDITTLASAGYVKAGTKPQTPGATWEITSGTVLLNISACTDATIKTLAEKLTEEEKKFLKPVSNPS